MLCQPDRGHHGRYVQSGVKRRLATQPRVVGGGSVGSAGQHRVHASPGRRSPSLVSGGLLARIPSGTRGLAPTHAAGRSGRSGRRTLGVTRGTCLDLGCGTGTDAIYLAIHGWDITGVDAVPKALATARRDASAAGVARFVQGDVTRLHELGVGEGYALIVDFGCFHTLPEDRRPAYVAGVSRLPRRERRCCCMVQATAQGRAHARRGDDR